MSLGLLVSEAIRFLQFFFSHLFDCLISYDVFEFPSVPALPVTLLSLCCELFKC